MTPKTGRLRSIVQFMISALALKALFSLAANAQTLSGEALIEALQAGGHVIVMRHASSTAEPPPPQERRPQNFNAERQLDERGRHTMTAMRFAFRHLGIPVGDVYSSPAYRALETQEHFGFGKLHVAPQAGTEQADVAWLGTMVSRAPGDSGNTVIITHAENLSSAFGNQAAGLQEGEALVFRPGDSPTLVARVTVEQWPALALNR